MLDVNAIRNDFPIFQRETKPGTPLVYLDLYGDLPEASGGARRWMPCYRRSNANIHRGVHTLAEEATALYEQAQDRRFINAFGSPDYLHPQHHRVHQPCRLLVGAQT